MKDLQKPCADCPFSRAVQPGALGGSLPDVYIGQSIGPFMMPCHKTCNFDDPAWRDSFEHTTSQCAGVAIFRANINVAHLLPQGLLRLPADREKVFASHAGFLAHHLQIPVSLAERILIQTPPQYLLHQEMAKSQVRFIKPREP